MVKRIFQNKVLPGVKTTFRSLQYRNYRLFFTGQSISLIGTWIQQVATPWLVFTLTNDVLLLGIVSFASQIPNFVLASVAGAISDRWNRYHIMIVAQVLYMCQALSMAALYFSGNIKVWHIILLSVALGCINAFDIPARQSLVPSMIGKKEDLGNAIALNSSMFNGARLLGPSIAGVLLAAANEGVCFLINGLSYIFVIGSLLKMKIPYIPQAKEKEPVFWQLKEGFRYTFGFAPIRAVILLIALISLMGMPYITLMPVFAKDILVGDSHTFGFLMAASGCGAMVAAIYLASRKTVVGLGRLIPWAAGSFGMSLAIFAISRSPAFSILMMAVTGMTMMLHTASSNTILQTIVDDDKRGRVMSFYSMAYMGAAPFGSLLAGTAAKIIGAPLALGVGGAVCIGGALYFAKTLPKLRKDVLPIYRRLGIIPEVARGLQTATDLTANTPKE